MPSPRNPPSGCRFHTRCPYAREACKGETPDRYAVEGDDDHRAACFRRVEDHEYWESRPLDADEQVAANQSATDPEEAADD